MLTQVNNLWASKRLGPIRQEEAQVCVFVTHAHNNPPHVTSTKNTCYKYKERHETQESMKQYGTKGFNHT